MKLFDVKAARAAIEGRPGAIRATRAIPAPPNSTNSTNSTALAAKAAIPLDPETPDGDARAYLRHLLDNGPATVGAAGSALGWGATRAWQAEARLRAAGMATMGPLGRAVPVRPRRPITAALP